MLFPQSQIRLKDNSGGIRVRCIKVLRSSRTRGLQPLGYAIVSVRRIKLNKNKIQKGGIYKALLIRRKKNFHRLNGDGVSFFDNSMILVNERGLPIASRIKGPIYKEFRSKFLAKIIILSNFAV